jgi:hypothetical protein
MLCQQSKEPMKLFSELIKPYQLEASEHLQRVPYGFLFAGMGLGKTASVLHAYNEMFDSMVSRGVLIVAPLRVAVCTWPDEVQEWKDFKWMKVANLRTKEGIEAWNNHAAQVYVINYESLTKIVDQLIAGRNPRDLPVDSVVFDEISVAKSTKSKRMKHFRKHASNKFERRHGLTGTPTPNSYEDLFAQSLLIDNGETFGKYITHFHKRFFKVSNPWSDYPKYEPVEGGADAIEKAMDHMTLTQRSEDHLKIPPTQIIDVPVTLCTDSRKAYKKIEKELFLELKSGDRIKAPTVAAMGQKLLQLTGGAIYTVDENDNRTGYETFNQLKIDQLRKLASKHKTLLVACNFRHEVKRIVDDLGAVEFSTELLADWNNGKIKILVANPKSISHGLNMQHGGSTIVWYGPTYSRETYDQFNARLARTGQKHETTIYRLIATKTIDETVIEALRMKGDSQSAFLRAMTNLQRLR